MKIKSERLYSVDILRGIEMILMALDHTRDYFHFVRFDPLDLTQTTQGCMVKLFIRNF